MNLATFDPKNYIMFGHLDHVREAVRRSCKTRKHGHMACLIFQLSTKQTNRFKVSKKQDRTRVTSHFGFPLAREGFPIAICNSSSKVLFFHKQLTVQVSPLPALPLREVFEVWYFKRLMDKKSHGVKPV